ncbi:OLC1v1031151C1 [Oldenlandia corymbosa var. corymbosa]|uniref:OLC1v1031151C1 n=1 Tax=Oldenlandia corymbosa var. corymbosa TaxID=529605 RepID=A0AAV1CJJ3_OLDCO|nr:OLC1v1031151C1 [Oldenlandia corymbosa var. corymbosa]
MEQKKGAPLLSFSFRLKSPLSMQFPVVAKSLLQNMVAKADPPLSDDAPLLGQSIAIDDVAHTIADVAVSVEETNQRALAVLPRVEAEDVATMAKTLVAPPCRKPTTPKMLVSNPEGSTSGLTTLEKIGILVDIIDRPPLPLISEKMAEEESPRPFGVDDETVLLLLKVFDATAASIAIAAPMLEGDKSTPQSIDNRWQPPEFTEGKEIPTSEHSSSQRCTASVETVALSKDPKSLSQSDLIVSVSKEDELKSKSPQFSPSDNEVIFPKNSSNNGSVKKLNPAAPKFSCPPSQQIPVLQVLLPISGPISDRNNKQFFSKDDTEVEKHIVSFNPSYSIEEIHSEGGQNHASNGSDDEDFDMKYAMEQEFFYSEVSTPTYHNRSKKAKAKKKVQVRRSARLDKDSTLL